MKFCAIGMPWHSMPRPQGRRSTGHVPDRIASPIADKATKFTSTCANRNNARSDVCVGHDAGETCQPSNPQINGGSACQ